MARRFLVLRKQPAQPRSKWRRRLSLVLLILLMLVAAGVYLTRPRQLTAIADTALEWFTGGQVTVRQARFTFSNGQIELDQVTLAAPDLPPEAARLLEVRHVLLDLDWAALLQGRLAVESLVALEPVLHLTQDLQTGRYNYQSLPLPRRDGDDTFLPQTLPEVLIRGGELRFAQVGASGFEERGRLRLEGNLKKNPANPRAYAFFLSQADQTGRPGATLEGSLDVERQQVTAQLHGFRFDRNQRQLLPAGLQHLWDLLDPRGSLPVLTVRYDHDTAGGLHAELEVRDVSLNLPVREINTRLQDVSGQFFLDNDRVTLKRISGLIEGVRYTIDGVVGALSLDAPLRLNVRTEPFTLPENPPFLAILPPVVNKHYHRFNPSGRFQADFTLTRDEKAGPLRYQGVLDLLDASACYYKFPYPVHGLHGRVHFSNERVWIESLQGIGPSGGQLTVTGTIAPPGDLGQVDITVTADHVPLDEHLFNAAEPKHLKLIKMFLHEPAYQRLIEQGLIRPADAANTPSTAPADQLAQKAPPAFSLGGRLAAHVQVHRDYGKDKRKRTTIEIRPDDAIVLLFEHWPYPLEAIDGRIIIEQDRVDVDHVSLRGPTGAKGVVSGSVQRTSDHHAIPDLTITNAYLPIDGFLLASIPSPQDQWVRDLHLTGTLQGQGRVFADPQGQIDWSFQLAVQDASARPHNGDFAAQQVNASLTLNRLGVQLEHLTAQHDKSPISLAGQVDWSRSEPAFQWRFTASDLAISPALLDLLPPAHELRPRLAQLWKRYQPSGLTDAELIYQTNPNDDTSGDYTLTLRPHELAITLPDQRIELHRMSGQAIIRPGQVELQQLAAQFDGGAMEATGLATPTTPTQAALTLSAQAQTITPTVRALLPQSALNVIDTLELQGGFKLEQARLLSRPTVTQGPQLEFEGRLRLHDAAAHVGVPITQLQGDLDLRVVQFAGIDTPHLELDLTAQRFRAAGRLVEPLSLRLSTDDQPGVLKLQDMHGQIYDGVLVGSGALELRPRGRYRLNLTLQDVAIEPFLDPPPDTDADSDADASLSQEPGWLSANLSVEAVYGRPHSRRGRGALEIRDARLYHRPLTMALLQAANLALPIGSSFDRAEARFLILGDTVHFDAIRFESPTVAIAGTGSMAYATQTLALTMYTRNPAAPNLGVIGDMFHIFKDQLLCIAVTGTLDQPQAKVVSFEGIRQSWNELFSSRRPPVRRSAAAARDTDTTPPSP